MLLFVTLSNTQKAQENLRKMSVPDCQMRAVGVLGWVFVALLWIEGCKGHRDWQQNKALKPDRQD